MMRRIVWCGLALAALSVPARAGELDRESTLRRPGAFAPKAVADAPAAKAVVAGEMDRESPTQAHRYRGGWGGWGRPGWGWNVGFGGYRPWYGGFGGYRSYYGGWGGYGGFYRPGYVSFSLGYSNYGWGGWGGGWGGGYNCW